MPPQLPHCVTIKHLGTQGLKDQDFWVAMLLFFLKAILMILGCEWQAERI